MPSRTKTCGGFELEQILIERQRRLADAADDGLLVRTAARERQPDGALPADVDDQLVVDALRDVAPAGRLTGALDCGAVVTDARAPFTADDAHDHTVAREVLESGVDDAVLAHAVKATPPGGALRGAAPGWTAACAARPPQRRCPRSPRSRRPRRRARCRPARTASRRRALQRGRCR